MALENHSNLVLSSRALKVLDRINGKIRDLRIPFFIKEIQHVKTELAAVPALPLARLIGRNARQPS
jgi:hypothetical protein